MCRTKLPSSPLTSAHLTVSYSFHLCKMPESPERLLGFLICGNFLISRMNLHYAMRASGLSKAFSLQYIEGDVTTMGPHFSRLETP